MANFIHLTLDTTAPSNPTLTILGGATFATSQLVDLTIGTTDSDKTGYMMLIYGDIDEAYDTNIKKTEGSSSWITYNNSKQIKLSSGDGSKTVYVKLRDDVLNTSGQATDSIILNTSLPTISMTNPDVNRISKQVGKNTASFAFTVDKEFVEYKIKVVGSTGASESTGTVIPVTNGSKNTSGTGTFPSGTPITVSINGSDLELANSGDGQKIIKVFCKDAAGLWSA